eukprot:g9665.t1
MCIDFLEAGRCDMELNCPFAHNPDELSGYQSFQRSDQHVHPEEHASRNERYDAFLRYLIDMGRASPSGARRW